MEPSGKGTKRPASDVTGGDPATSIPNKVQKTAAGTSAAATLAALQAKGLASTVVATNSQAHYEIVDESHIPVDEGTKKATGSPKAHDGSTGGNGTKAFMEGFVQKWLASKTGQKSGKEAQPKFPVTSVGDNPPKPTVQPAQPADQVVNIGQVAGAIRDGNVIYEVPFEISVERQVLEGKAQGVQAVVEVTYE